MEAREYYEKRLNENPDIGSVQLMEEYAKHVIEMNFCDGSPTNFDDLKLIHIRSMHKAVNLCVEWVNED